ncbi:MFS transporter [Microvirga sp. KLBC 81]|nr:MFS transporter [Microvirga sp. KLBC 81]
MFTAEVADPARAWIAVGLLFLFMLINFADRAVLGLAAVPIMQELGLSHTQFGLIGASFFTLFSLGAVIGGFLVNRIAAKWVLAALAMIWSLCQLPMLLPVSMAALIANRIALGFGEGPAYPVAAHAAYKWFPNERRALPTSLIAIGALSGNGIVAPMVVFIIASWSWHAAFGLLGTIGLIWCAVWLAFAREGPLTPNNMSMGGPEAHLSYRRLLGCRTVIGVQVVGFFAYWLLTVAVIWLPAILNQAFGYTPVQAGWIMMLIALCQIVLLPVVSAISDGLQQRGVSSRLACGWMACASTVAAGLLTLLLSQSGGSITVVLCTVLAFSLCNVIFVLAPCLIAEVTPVRQRGAILGVNTAIVTLAGPFAPSVMGLVVDSGLNPADGYRMALTLTGSLVILGGLSGFFLIDPEADRADNPPAQSFI